MSERRMDWVDLAEQRLCHCVEIDNNLGSRPEYLRDLCRALRPLNRIWSAAVSIDVTDRPDLIREMALADGMESTLTIEW